MTFNHMEMVDPEAAVEDLVVDLEEMVEEVEKMVGYQVSKKPYLEFLVRTTQSMLMSLNLNSHVMRGLKGGSTLIRQLSVRSSTSVPLLTRRGDS